MANSTGVTPGHPNRLKQVPDNQSNCYNRQTLAASQADPSSPLSSTPHLDIQLLEEYVGRTRSPKTVYSDTMPFSIYDQEVQDQAKAIEIARNPNEEPTTSSQTTLDSSLCRLKTSILAANIQKSATETKGKFRQFARVCPPPASQPPQLSRLITQRSLKHRRLHPYSRPPLNFSNAADNLSNHVQPVCQSGVVGANPPFTAPTPTFIATFNVTNYAAGSSMASPPPESGYAVNDQPYASDARLSDVQLHPASGDGAASPTAVQTPPLLSHTKGASCENGEADYEGGGAAYEGGGAAYQGGEAAYQGEGAAYEDGGATYESGGPVIISYQSLHGSDARATPVDQREFDCDISIIRHPATIKREVKDFWDIGSANLKTNLSLGCAGDEKVELEETGNIFDILACKKLY